MIIIIMIIKKKKTQIQSKIKLDYYIQNKWRSIQHFKNRRIIYCTSTQKSMKIEINRTAYM